MFCVYCGKPNPDNASFCSACGKAVLGAPAQTAVPDPLRSQPHDAATPAAQTAATQVQPKLRSHRLRNGTLIGVGIAVAIVVAAIMLSGQSPTDSLEKAGAAFAHQDPQSFDNYVDVQSVLGDWTDQVASSWLASNNGNSGDALLANGLVTGFKSLVVPKLVSSVEQQILGSGAPDQQQASDSDTATNFMTNYLSTGIHSLLRSQLTYQGVASQTKSGSDAMLDVRVGSPLSANPFIVQVRMQQVGDHWRIVAIPNVAGLLAQLHPAQ